LTEKKGNAILIKMTFSTGYPDVNKIIKIQSALIFSLSVFCSSSNRLIENGAYYYSHAYSNSDTTNIIPGPENYYEIKKDSVYYYEYEPYIKPKRGYISTNKFILNSTDTIQFQIIKEGFEIKKDTITEIYQKK
jgi:hypothetical protein